MIDRSIMFVFLVVFFETLSALVLVDLLSSYSLKC